MSNINLQLIRNLFCVSTYSKDTIYIYNTINYSSLSKFLLTISFNYNNIEN